MKRKRWTLADFVTAAQAIHGEKYDYSLITINDIDNAHSKVPVRCRGCNDVWHPVINAHISAQSGCPRCCHKGKKAITLTEFIDRATAIHGEKYDYSLITNDHIKTVNSKVPIRCYGCSNVFCPPICAHISAKTTGCPRCCKHKKHITLTEFLYKSQAIHGDKFDYSAITDAHVCTIRSRIPIQCRTCRYSWNPTITSHIYHQSGCPNCAGNARWTYDRFLERAKVVHKDNFDYSLVKPSDIVNLDSIVKLKCNACFYVSNVKLESHLQGHNCGNCASHAPWTLERFQSTPKREGFDYSKVTAIDNGFLTEIPLRCLSCNFEWRTKIGHHFGIAQTGCPRCGGKEKWTLQRFLERAREVHGDNYDYSLLQESDIVGYRSKLTLRCNRCGGVWNTCTSDSHIHKAAGCPACRTSHGERKCLEEIQKLHGVHCETQFVLVELSSHKAFDCYFVYSTRRYLLEYDGIQHFRYMSFFHRQESKFAEQQERDIKMTLGAIQAGYMVIRIDYTCEKQIAEHLARAIATTDKP